MHNHGCMVNKAKTLYNRNQNINKNTELASKSIFCPKYAPHGKTDKLFSPPPTPKKKKELTVILATNIKIV